MLDSLNMISNTGGLVNNSDHPGLFTRTQLSKTVFSLGEITQVEPEANLVNEVVPERREIPSLPNEGMNSINAGSGMSGKFGTVRSGTMLFVTIVMCNNYIVDKCLVFLNLVSHLTHLCHETVFRVNKRYISNIKRERERKKKKQKERKREREAVEQKIYSEIHKEFPNNILLGVTKYICYRVGSCLTA